MIFKKKKFYFDYLLKRQIDDNACPYDTYLSQDELGSLRHIDFFHNDIFPVVNQHYKNKYQTVFFCPEKKYLSKFIIVKKDDLENEFITNQNLNSK